MRTFACTTSCGRRGGRLDEADRSPQRVATNIHLRAKGVAVELNERTKEVAVRASKTVGLEISGVDMIFRGEAPNVLEVNVSPGFRGLLEATGVNAAVAMGEYAFVKARARDPKWL